ncbi:hypothetical protein [Nocardioides sp. P5_C9_2]
MRLPRRLSVPISVPLVLAGALSSCSGDVDGVSAGSRSPSAAETTLERCRDLLPDEALDAMGWDLRGEPSLDGSSCVQLAAQGAVRVQRRPVGAGSAQELPAAAQRAFDDRCAELGGMVGDAAGEEVAWLGEENPACVAPAEGETGTTALLVLWPASSLLVEARVEADEPTAPDAVQAAVTSLARAAEQEL